MKIRTDQLPTALQNLSPMYLLSGEEILLVQEALDSIRARAREKGYEERHVFTVEPGFDWKIFLGHIHTLSLFASHRLFELRFSKGKLGDAGSKALQEYAATLPADTVLIIITDKLDAQNLNSSWCKAIDKVGVIVQAWPLDRSQLSGWVKQRLKKTNIETTPEGIERLVFHSEGNLLATAQEIEKLHLMFGPGKISAEAIEQAVSDTARFNVFQLVDAILQGNAARVIRMMKILRSEDNEQSLLLWAIARELRQLLSISSQQAQGHSLDHALQSLSVWEKRKSLYKNSVTRHSHGRWLTLLRYTAFIDRLIKGLHPGNPWDELLTLSLRIAGVKILR